MKKAIPVILALIIALCLCGSCGGSRSSSGKKWSDLSDVEKANAKWAYEVQQELEDMK